MNINLDKAVNHRIAMVASLLKRQVYRIIAQAGLDITPDQWVILSYLWGSNGLLIKELVQLSNKDFANVTRIVEKLHYLGLINKIKNKTDKRSYSIWYTDKSLAIKDQINKCQQRSLDISMKDVSDNERAQILLILEKIEQNTLNFLNNT